jgi:hypothetical protein
LIGVIKPIYVALIAALPTEICDLALDGYVGDTIKGLPTDASLFAQSISFVTGVMHCPWSLLLRWTHSVSDSPAFLLLAAICIAYHRLP